MNREFVARITATPFGSLSLFTKTEAMLKGILQLLLLLLLVGLFFPNVAATVGHLFTTLLELLDRLVALLASRATF